MIYIFDKFKNISASEYSRLYNLLPPSRKQKADSRAGLDKQICILEYFILKHLLKFDGYPDFEYSPNGKPKFQNFHFSFAHANNVLCIAIEPTECGIDVEKLSDFNPKIANYLLNENELNRLNKCKNKSLMQTKFFTQKEATTKCLGVRLNCDLKNIVTPAFKYIFKRYKGHVICECIQQ